MSAQHVLTILRERWASALLTALLVLGTVAGVTALQQPVYESTASIFVRTDTSSSVADRSAAADYARQQIATYTDIVDTPLVLDPVIEELGLSTTSAALADRVSALVPQDTLLIKVTARADTPEESAQTANAVADSLRTQVSTLEGGGSIAVELTVVTPAVPPAAPASPDVVQNAALGLLAAVMAGVLVAALRDLLDNKVRKEADVALVTDSPVIATVPAVRTQGGITSLAAHGPQTEAFRELRTNLRFLGAAQASRSLLITSSVQDEGKSATAIQLAAAFARAGSSVLLVDADLRNPSVHRYLGVEGGAGLTTVLIGDARLDDVVQHLEIENLSVLASGPVPPNPGELLDSEPMHRLLSTAAATYDVVIVDSAPLLAVSDALPLARRIAGTLFVTGSGSVRRTQLAQALRKLQLVEVRPLGIVLNGVSRGDLSPYASAYGGPDAYGTPPVPLADAPLDTADSTPPPVAEAAPEVPAKLLAGSSHGMHADR